MGIGRYSLVVCTLDIQLKRPSHYTHHVHSCSLCRHCSNVWWCRHAMSTVIKLIESSGAIHSRHARHMYCEQSIAFNKLDYNRQQRPFNGLWSGTTRVGRYQKKHSPTDTHPNHRASFITFLHLQRTMASYLFNLRAWQSSRTTSFQVFFGLPLGLEPSTSCSIHFFTQSSSSFRMVMCCEKMTMTGWRNVWSGWMFLLVPAYPGCPGSKAVKRSLLLLLPIVIQLIKSNALFTVHMPCVPTVDGTTAFD